MTIEAKRQYYTAIINRYKKARKSEKGIILGEFCAVCGYSRKYAIRMLNQEVRARNKRGRKPIYRPEVIKHLKRLWLLTDQMCSKRLKAALPFWLPHDDISNPVKVQLLQMSPATIDRYLKPYRAALRRKRNCGTTPGSLIKNRIPIQPHAGTSKNRDLWKQIPWHTVDRPCRETLFGPSP